MNLPRFTLSVDDGHPLDLKMADLLDRHDLAATFYVPMANCEGPPVMTAPQLRSMASRFELGSHTAEHRFLTRLGCDAAWHQIRDGKAELEDILGQRVHGFCYPGGHYRHTHVAMVRTAGFTHARTTQNLRMDAGTRAYELPTSLQFYPHPRGVLLRNFVSQADWSLRLPALVAACATPDWLDRLYALFSHACGQGAMFHLWLHTADVDALQLWSVLDEFFGCVARRVPRSQRLTNGAWFRQAFRLQETPASPMASRMNEDGLDGQGLGGSRAQTVRPVTMRPEAVPPSPPSYPPSSRL